MKPIIGVTASENEKETHLKGTYIQRILEAGGIPMILSSDLVGNIDSLITRIDGFLLTGGGDIDPIYFDEDPHPNLGDVTPKRDAFEIQLVKSALQTKKPMLGICRGMQVIIVAAGGNMYQDLYKQRTKMTIQHDQQAPTSHASHSIQLTAGSRLREIAEAAEIRVNSFHHQAVKDVPEPFIISAVSNDGVIEAIESAEHPFIVGVQWHPEDLQDAFSEKVFEKFIIESSGENERN